MPAKIETATVKTICYSDIFDYPLTEEEIWRWLIKVKSQKSKVKNTIEKLKIIKEKDGYYFLKGRGNIVNLRKERKRYSQQKLKIANKIINIIKIIPSVKLIGITGALAVDNAKEEDDIDLFIITSNGLLWTTRFLATFVVEAIGKRRRPKEEKVNNKVCLNMFVDENYLEIPKREQDLFSAHEVVQMRPLFNRNNIYLQFLIANKWIDKYLPNALNIKYQISLPRRQAGKIKNTHSTSSGQAYKKSKIFSFIETALKKFQLWYMRNRRTKEIIKEGIIRFHPQDARQWVMKKYKNRLRIIGDYKGR